MVRDGFELIILNLNDNEGDDNLFMKKTVIEFNRKDKHGIDFRSDIDIILGIDFFLYKKIRKKFKNSGVSFINGDKKNVLAQFNFLNHFMLNDIYTIKKEKISIEKEKNLRDTGKNKYYIDSTYSIRSILNVGTDVRKIINEKFKINGIYYVYSESEKNLQNFVNFLNEFFC